jgi:GT2 family glycosyltransferase
MTSTSNVPKNVMAMRPRSVYDSVGVPFYIFAPDYRNTSGGIRILHYFCHILNELGEEAYLVNAVETSPKLRTPILTYERMREHFLAGKNPITVYPEVVDTNPFSTPLIMRWLLNVPGHLGKPVQFEDKDIICYYEPWCLPEDMDGQFLHVDPLNYAVFNNLDNPDDHDRTFECVYANKYYIQGDPIKEEHQGLTSLGQEIKRTPEEIASILRKAKVLYVYEPSGIINEAQACGCPVLLVRTAYWPLPADDSHHQLPGVAVYGEPGAYEKASQEQDLVIKNHTTLRDDSWTTTKAFIETVYSVHQDYVEKGKPIINEVQALWQASIEDRAELIDAFEQYYTSCGLFRGTMPGGHVQDAENWYDNGQLIRQVQIIQEQTGVTTLNIALSLLDKRDSTFSTNEERELFLLQACMANFESLKDGDIGVLTRAGEVELHEVMITLKSDRFELKRNLASELSQQIYEWQVNADYRRWMKAHSPQEIDIQLHAERMMQWAEPSCFHIVMFLFDGEEELLADTIDSLGQQFYKKWKLTVFADSPCPAPIFEELDSLQWIQFPGGVEPYAYLNQVIAEQVSTEWIWFVPAGTQFEPHAFLHFGDYIDRFQHKLAFYCDDDLFSVDGVQHSPRFKPEFNLDLLRSSDYIGPLLCHSDLFIAVGGLSPAPGYENMDLALKVVERVGTPSIAHISDLLVHLPECVKNYQSQTIMMEVVQNHLNRLGTAATVEPGMLPEAVRVLYQWQEKPLVSIVIPTKDRLEMLRPCVESVLNKTDYPNYEILIVNNQSQDPDTLAYFDDVQHKYGDKVSVIDYPHEFNYAAISNMASREVRGDYLLFLNNDTEALRPNWLDNMMHHAQRPEVGIVGARLVYPEKGIVQHVGTILGLTDISGHPYVEGLDINEPGYMGRALIEQNYSAVTGACMLIRKSLYEEVGGMNEVDLAVLFNDIDLCLKVGQTGHLVVWTPYATLVHHHSISIKGENLQFKRAGQARNERIYMLSHWQEIISNDPAYSPHLSLANTNIRIESDMPINWDKNFHDRTRVMALPLMGGSGEYRVVTPLDALSYAGIAQCEYYRYKHNITRSLRIPEYARLAPDVVVFHAAVNDNQLLQIEEVKGFLPEIKCIYTIDDLLTNVPEYSPAYKSTKQYFSNAKQRLRRALAACDALIVSTQPLADLCEDMIDEIHVVPNRLTVQKWGNLSPAINEGEKPRIGWAGAQQHKGDLAIIAEVVKATADKVDWIFMGMCAEEIEPYIKELHDFVDIEAYPEKLASLALDLAIAPLEVNEFNEAKSNLRLLEYGIMGWPVICTDIYPYQTNNAPVTRVKNTKQDWLDAIEHALAHPEERKLAGEQLKAWVLEHYILEDHLDEWVDALGVDILPHRQ